MRSKRVPGLIMSYMSKFAAAAVGLLVMAIVISRQLFLFTVFRNPQGFLDPPGGRYHLWLAIISAVIAVITGVLMFYFFGRHNRNEWSQTTKTPPAPAIAVPSHYPTVNSSARAPLDAKRWAQLNPWLSEGQADDRSPMRGTDGVSSGALSVRRSTARRSHQEMYKKWSQARHD
jgi:hypothetical protein